MADFLYDSGKVAGMTGILGVISYLTLATSTGTVLATATITTPSNVFSVNATSGVLSNSVASIEFTIADTTPPIGEIASQLIFFNVTDDELLSVDLDTTVTLTTAGTATLAIGALTADL